MASPGGNPNPNPDPLLKEAENIALRISELRRNLLSTIDLGRDLAKEFNKSSIELKTSFELSTDVKHSLDDIRSIASKLGRDYIDQELIQGRINANQVEQAVVAAELLSLRNNMQISEADLVTKYQEILSYMQSGDETLRSQVSAQDIALVNLIEELEVRKQITGELDKINNSLDKGNNKVKETQLKASALGRIFQNLTGIPFLKDFMDFKKISDAFNVSGAAGVRAFGSELLRVVKSPLFLALASVVALVAAFKALVKLALDFDKQLVKISNNLGFTRNSTIAILDNFREISDENKNIVNGLDSAFLSVKNQAAATAELQEILETNSMFTSKMIQTQILLTKQMGLSKEEAAGIQKLSLLSGKSADDILQNAIKQNNTAISYRKIISEISKVNSEISVMYKNNPDLIAKAVIQANKLGMSLEQTQKISKSLLDFESSIAGELEAELLLGKRFNFEKARALALDGKSAEAAKELIDQMGGLNGLTQLNVIQRDRLAASIGQSAEELTKAAREAEILNQLGFENKRALEEQYALLRERNDTAGISALMEQARKKEGGEILLQDIARADLQQRFQESVEKLKQVFTEIAAGPMIKMIEGLVKFLSNANTLKGVFIALAGLAAAIATSVIIATGGIAAITGGLAAAGTGYLLYREGSDTNYATPSPNLTSASVVPDVNRESTSFYSPNQSNMVPTTNAAVPNNTNPVEQMNTMASAKTATPSSLATQSNALASPTISLSEDDLLEKSSISYTAPRMGDNIMKSTMNNNSSVNNQMNNQNEYNQNNINNRDVAFNDKPAPIEANIYVDIDGIRVKQALMKLDRP